MHGTSYTLTREYTRASAEQVQMEIVMGTSFVQLNFEKFGTCTTETWLKMMWNNLRILEIELLWSEPLSLPLHIEWETYIMEEFAGLYDMDKRTTRRLNQVRLPMKIYALSDLATGNGLSIRQDIVSSCTPGTEK